MSVMIWLIAHDLCRTVDLLQYKRARPFVQQGQTREGPDEIRALHKAFVGTERASDNQRQATRAGVRNVRQLGAELFAAQLRSGSVEQPHAIVLVQQPKDSPGFLRQAPRSGMAYFDDLQRIVWPQPLDEFVACLADVAFMNFADGNNAHVHAALFANRAG